MDQTSIINPNSAVMAEQTLSELVMNLISWIESLHQKNLKYEAQVDALSRDLAIAKKQLETQSISHQGSSSQLITDDVKEPLHQQPQLHHLHPQQQQQQQQPPQHQQQQQPQPQQQQQPHVIYQQMPATAPVFPPQQPQYIWSYDHSSTSNGTAQVPYYDHYAANAPAFAQQQQ